MTTTDQPADDDIDLRPILGVIARAWRRIHPSELTADEALSLLTILMGIINRLDDHQAPNIADRPTLRLVKTESEP